MQHTHKGPLLCTLSGWVGGWEGWWGGYVYVLCVIQQPGFERVHRDCGSESIAWTNLSQHVYLVLQLWSGSNHMDAAVLRDDGDVHKLGSFSLDSHGFVAETHRRKKTLNKMYFFFLCIFSGFDTDARLSLMVLHTDCVRAPHLAGSKRSHMLRPAKRGSKASHPARQPESKLPARGTCVCTCQFT